MQTDTETAPKTGKGMLRISLILFLLFFVNLLVGKGNVMFHWGLPHLDSLAEFLLLGAASTTLIWAALKREEAAEETTRLQSKEEQNEGNHQ